MIKRGGQYLLTYSEGWFANDTYKVGYSVAPTPYGPFTQGANSPILETSGNIRGPGHHSLFQDDGQDYIIYHRHRVPFNPFWEILRQLAVDPITIRNNGVIDDVSPTHNGVSGWGWRFDGNLARGAAVTASSSYSGDYTPASAVDDNNATRWAASGYASQSVVTA